MATSRAYTSSTPSKPDSGIGIDMREGNTSKGKGVVVADFDLYVKEKLLEARQMSSSMSRECRKLFITNEIPFINNSTFSRKKMYEALNCLPEVAEDKLTLNAILYAADAMRQEQEDDMRNNNASPELFSTPLAYLEPNVPGTGRTATLTTKPPLPRTFGKSGKKNEQGLLLPSVKASKFPYANKNPLNEVYHFVGVTAPITPKPKKPRFLKPGEIVFSKSGSPIEVPVVPAANSKAYGNARTPGNNNIGVDKPVRLEVPDPKGTFEVEIAYRRGASEQQGLPQAFAGFVTDIRGLISTRSTVRASKRLQNLRVPVKGSKGATTASAKKKTWRNI